MKVKLDYLIHFLLHWYKDQLAVGGQSMDVLQNRFGAIPWDDIRLIVRTIDPSSNCQLAARSEGCRGTLVSFPGEVEVIPQRHQGTIERILHSLHAVLDSERRTEGEELLKELAECLRLTCGRQKRKGGGWQYIDSFMLDSVLFADNLRPLYDGDLMRDSVKQNLWNLV